MINLEKIQKEAEELFEKKCNMISAANGRTVYNMIMHQVGPNDAEVIIKQMEAFFLSGYFEGLKKGGLV